jgi:hypothetical protein
MGNEKKFCRRHSVGDFGLGTLKLDPNVAFFEAANLSRGEIPKIGVKLWIEHKKRKWSRNSVKSLKALAWWWLLTTQA